MPSSQRASLLGLPPELRLSIFEHAIHDSSVGLRHYNPTRKNPVRSSLVSIHLNRQIRAEILSTFYELALFKLLDGFTLDDLEAWLDHVGPTNIARIKRVEFNCRAKCSMYGLQPDSDYCHRTVVIDLVARPPEGPGGEELRQAVADCIDEDGICSNRADGCMDATMGAAWKIENPEGEWNANATRGEVMRGLLVEVFEALSGEHSASAA